MRNKILHDGGVAVIESNRLLFSIELEKLDNGLRYSSLGDLGRVTQILEAEGPKPAQRSRPHTTRPSSCADTRVLDPSAR
jgi:carbamoyltransferase